MGNMYLWSDAKPVSIVGDGHHPESPFQVFRKPAEHPAVSEILDVDGDYFHESS